MKYLITFIGLLLQRVDQLLVLLKIVRPKVIIYMDGGICSQMLRYLNGQYYRDYPLKIYYDVDWFQRCGKDMDGRFERTLEITEMFPHLPFNVVSKNQRKYYRLFFRLKQLNGEYLPKPESITHTVYLGYYYAMYQCDYDRLFENVFKIENTPITSKHIKIEDGVVNCAVHIRRGDLANRTNKWYHPIPDQYFFDSIEYCKKKYSPIQYYFFSDELDWVENNICSKIDVDYVLMRDNKAYEDLLLISECDVVIASQGSFGRVGAKLNGRSELITPETFYESIRCSHNI